MPLQLLDLPPEILVMILYQCIIACTSTGPRHGVIRGLRLRLVCKAFYQPVETALFQTRLLDVFDMRKDCPDVPLLMNDLPIRRFYGADEFWKRYIIYRTINLHRQTDIAFVRLEAIARRISVEMPLKSAEEVRETVCGLAIEPVVLGMTEYFDGSESVFDPLGGVRRTARRARWLAQKDSKFDDDLLSVAAYLNLGPLARQLLQKGANPLPQRGLFMPAALLAACAGHREMLGILQHHIWFVEKTQAINKLGRLPNPPNFDNIERTRTQQARAYCIIGSAIHGDLHLFKESINRGASDIWRRPPIQSQSVTLPFPFGNTIILRRAVPSFTRVAALDAVWPYIRHRTEKNQLISAMYPRPDECSLGTTWTKSLRIWKYSEENRILRIHPVEKHRHLCKASSDGNLELVRHLVDKLGVNVNGEAHRKVKVGVDVDGEPREEEPIKARYINSQPLRLAASASHEHIVDFLLRRGANPNILPFADDKNHFSPLSAAAAAGSLTIATKLMDYGAIDDNGAFIIAAMREHTGILNLIRDRGQMTKENLDIALRDCVAYGLESMVRLLWSWGARLEEPLDYEEYFWEDYHRWQIDGSMKAVLAELEAADKQ